MKFTILKNWHYSLPPLLGFSLSKEFVWSIQFDRTAKYNIDKDQIAINKLIGITYLSGVHKDSARFGWRYNNQFNTMKVEIFSYVYDSGIRSQTLMGVVNPDTEYLYTLFVHEDKYEFVLSTLSGEKISNIFVNKTHKRKFSILRGLYFGGIRRAPHNISVKIKRITV